MGIGIALAGGGIRGIAHAGVLKALDENGIKILLQEHYSTRKDHSYLLLSLMMAEEALKEKER